MDRRRRNLRHELNRAFHRALDMPTVGPNSYHQLFESARTVCLLKLPNDPSKEYHGADMVTKAFINAASRVYFATDPKDIAFAHYNSLYAEPASKPLEESQGELVNLYRSRFHFAGRRHEISTDFQNAFRQGVTAAGSIEVISQRGHRLLIQIPNMTDMARTFLTENRIVLSDNRVYLGYVSEQAITRCIEDMGITLQSREQVLNRVLKERYGRAPH